MFITKITLALGIILIIVSLILDKYIERISDQEIQKNCRGIVGYILFVSILITIFNTGVILKLL